MSKRNASHLVDCPCLRCGNRAANNNAADPANNVAGPAGPAAAAAPPLSGIYNPGFGMVTPGLAAAAPGSASAATAAAPGPAAAAVPPLSGVGNLRHAISVVRERDHPYYSVYLSRAFTCAEIQDIVGIDPMRNPGGGLSTAFRYTLSQEGVRDLRGQAAILGYAENSRIDYADASSE